MLWHNAKDDRSSCEEGAIRLRGGTEKSNGCVEVCRHRTWGAVCSDGWDDRDAEVICRQLGFDPSGEIILFGIIHHVFKETTSDAKVLEVWTSQKFPDFIGQSCI